MYCTGHRIFLASVVVACKYLHDHPIKNKSWSAHTQHRFSLAEINLMERQFLYLIDFDLELQDHHFNDLFMRATAADVEGDVTAGPGTMLGELAEILSKIDRMMESPTKHFKTTTTTTAGISGSIPSSPKSLTSGSGKIFRPSVAGALSSSLPQTMPMISNPSSPLRAFLKARISRGDSKSPAVGAEIGAKKEVLVPEKPVTSNITRQMAAQQGQGQERDTSNDMDVDVVSTTDSGIVNDMMADVKTTDSAMSLDIPIPSRSSYLTSSSVLSSSAPSSRVCIPMKSAITSSASSVSLSSLAGSTSSTPNIHSRNPCDSACSLVSLHMNSRPPLPKDKDSYSCTDNFLPSPKHRHSQSQLSLASLSIPVPIGTPSSSSSSHSSSTSSSAVVTPRVGSSHNLNHNHHDASMETQSSAAMLSKSLPTTSTNGRLMSYAVTTPTPTVALTNAQSTPRMSLFSRRGTIAATTSTSALSSSVGNKSSAVLISVNANAVASAVGGSANNNNGNGKSPMDISSSARARKSPVVPASPSIMNSAAGILARPRGSVSGVGDENGSTSSSSSVGNVNINGRRWWWNGSNGSGSLGSVSGNKARWSVVSLDEGTDAIHFDGIDGDENGGCDDGVGVGKSGKGGVDIVNGESVGVGRDLKSSKERTRSRWSVAGGTGSWW
ncbi:hypothetical protein HDU76_012076 [Blyttiomyces sp. JEL0837]|nr:hypothetical protein HDU76_012076 [Blyttiomyces sp. JEL0837]